MLREMGLADRCYGCSPPAWQSHSFRQELERHRAYTHEPFNSSAEQKLLLLSHLAGELVRRLSPMGGVCHSKSIAWEGILVFPSPLDLLRSLP